MIKQNLEFFIQIKKFLLKKFRPDNASQKSDFFKKSLIKIYF